MPRSAAHRMLGVVVLLTSAACGEPIGEHGTRLAVTQRSFDWKLSGEAGRHPFSLSWTFDQGDDHGFRHGDGRVPTLESGALLARGLDRVVLRTPPAAHIDAELLQRLTLRVSTRDTGALRLRWRGPGQAFDDARSTSAMALAPGSQVQSLSVALAGLRGLRDASDASEGLEQLELVFEGAPGSRPEVRLVALSLVSDFDNPRLAPFRLGRAAIHRRGICLPSPGEASVSLRPHPQGRLRMALAAAGVDTALRVQVTFDPALVPAFSLELQPGAPWYELSVDLSPAAGAALTVQVRAEGAAGAVFLGSVLLLAPTDRARPDLLLYLEDTLRRDRLGLYGHPFPTDPSLSQLASQGVTCERTWSASSWTRPSVSSLLTALDPLAHGNISHDRRVPDAALTLAEVLGDAGFVTVALVSNYHAGAWSGLDQGFDVFAEPPAWGASALTSTLTSALLAEPLAATLAEHRDEQLFTYVHSLDPHEPYEPPSSALQPLLAGAASRATVPGGPERQGESLRYDGEVRHNDDQLAALAQALKDNGRDADTLFVFLSDHGEAFGEHGAFRHRNTLFDEELAIPLVLRWPARLPAGARLSLPLGLVDVAPSLLGLMDVAVPPLFQGRDLSAALLDPHAHDLRDAPLLAHLLPEDGGTPLLAVLSWPHKLLLHLPDGGEPVPVALYDLQRDPGELHNRIDAADSAGVTAGLLTWTRTRLADNAARAFSGEADPMDEATRRWMLEMGYLGR